MITPYEPTAWTRGGILFDVLSSNMKTRASVNFLPGAEENGGTCHETSICAIPCYGKHGRLGFPEALNKAAWVTQQVLQDKIQPERILWNCGFRRDALPSLRWCGNGDLTPAAARLFMDTARADRSGRIHYVFTRRLDILENLAPLENVRVIFSLDRASLDRYDKIPDTYRSWLRLAYLRDTEEVPDIPIHVVFPLREGAGFRQVRAPWKHRKDCPAGVKIPEKDACIICGRCWK